MAIALAWGLAWTDNAQALALGRANVLSALGEPLRAEIDIPEISAEETASLRAAIASQDNFRTAGVEYNPALNGLQVTLQKRPDGRSYLRLSSDKAVNDPFIDLILEANWSAGRIVRDYTLLFDPANLRSAPVAVVTPAVAAPAASPAPASPAPVMARAESAPPAPANAPSNPIAVAEKPKTPTPAAAKAAPKPAAVKAAADAGALTVRAGDTAGKIAAQVKPDNISLDQMLLGLLRSNPDAFIAGNINRIKAGAVLTMPDAAQLAATPSAEARKSIVAQSRDFNEFRSKLSSIAPAAQVDSPKRQSAGKVQASVEERKAAVPAPDKLKLSKAATPAQSAAEEKIAKDRQSKESSQRVAELSKNIADLNKLSAQTGAGGAAVVASAAKSALNTPAVTTPVLVASAPAKAASALAAPALSATASIAAASAAKAASVAASAVAPAAVASAVAPAAVASAAAPVASAASPTVTVASASVSVASAPAPLASAPTPVATASAPAPVKPVVVPALAEKDFMDELLDNPLPIAGGVLGLLGLLGFGAYKLRQRKQNSQIDSSFLESRLQPDSFFGASGGQRVDTNEGTPTGSSMVYSPSQLDAAGDVDPVAEADVYLAYGRDLQAEEILKEAMRINPARVAIHAKLTEIYAKRRDAKAFEVVAIEAHGLTKGEGQEWAHICELGRDLDSSNPLYQNGGTPPVAAAPMPVAAAAFASSTLPQSLHPELGAHSQPSDPSLDFDLDLDFTLGDSSTAHAFADAPAGSQSASPDIDFGLAAASLGGAFSAAQNTVKLPANELGAGHSIQHAAAAPAPASNSGMIEFDMHSLSLDLDAPAPAPAPVVTPVVHSAASPAGALDPLETKLSLAREFHIIGDSDGARVLAQEVLAQADGALKAKAQKFLTELA